MTPQETAEKLAPQIIDRLKANYNGNVFAFDVAVGQHVAGKERQLIRREIIRRVTGVTRPLSECTIAAVSDCLRHKFQQYSIF